MFHVCSLAKWLLTISQTMSLVRRDREQCPPGDDSAEPQISTFPSMAKDQQIHQLDNRPHTSFGFLHVRVHYLESPTFSMAKHADRWLTGRWNNNSLNLKGPKCGNQRGCALPHGVSPFSVVVKLFSPETKRPSCTSAEQVNVLTI